MTDLPLTDAFGNTIEEPRTGPRRTVTGTLHYDQPLTDEELAESERDLISWFMPLRAEDRVRRLVAEVKRLRSDEWLEKAAEEIAESAQLIGGYGGVLAILRKHRNGKA